MLAESPGCLGLSVLFLSYYSAVACYCLLSCAERVNFVPDVTVCLGMLHVLLSRA